LLIEKKSGYIIIIYQFYFTDKQNESPEPEPGCDFEAVEEAKELWKTLKASAQSPQVFTIQMEQIAPFGESVTFALPAILMRSP